jgi:hypothetical protein
MGKSNIKKDDRIVWFLKIYQASIADNDQLQKMVGNYQFTDINKFKDDFGHFFGYRDQKIQNYQFKNQTISDAIDKLKELEEVHLEDLEEKKPVTPQEGDYELIKFKDGSACWFVNRAYCPDEGRSGQHCGNVDGQDRTEQRILSYRKDGHVQMSFILEPNGFLGEMKAKANKKPSEKMHPYIMSLLLNPIVKGLEGGGYKPEVNFSIFDLDEKKS